MFVTQKFLCDRPVHLRGKCAEVCPLSNIRLDVKKPRLVRSLHSLYGLYLPLSGRSVEYQKTQRRTGGAHFPKQRARKNV